MFNTLHNKIGSVASSKLNRLKRVCNDDSCPIWALSPERLTDVSAGPVDYISNSLNLQTIPYESPIWLDGKLWQLGSWKEYCTNPMDVMAWAVNGAIKSDTLIRVGGFKKVSITDTGAPWNGIWAYQSTINGNPPAGQYVSILYEVGSSNSGRIYCYDITTTMNSLVAMNSGVWSVQSSSAGAISDLKDELVFGSVRRVSFKILWAYPTNPMTIFVGPNSSNGSNIYLYGAVINDLCDIWPLFNSVGGTTITSRAGVAYCNMTLDSTNYKLLEGLGGKASGADLVQNGDFSLWTGDNPDGFSVLNENSANYITQHARGVRIVSNNTSVLQMKKVFTGLVPESVLEFKMVRSDVVNGNVRIRVDDETNVVQILGAQNITPWPYVLRIKVPAACTSIAISIFRDTSGAGLTDYVMNSWSLKVVGNAASKTTFDWQPYYNSAGATVAQTIFKTATKTIAFDAMSGNITLNDGVNTATVALTTWSSKDVIKFKILCGDNHPSYPGVKKMQICASKDGGATWINSSVVDFGGSLINYSDRILYFGEDTLPQAISDLKVWAIKGGDWPI